MGVEHVTTNHSHNDMNYADRAFIAFSDIMANNQKNMLEDINRVNKGERFVLQFLDMSGAAVLPSELSIALQSSTARISALLNSLEKKGQIARDIDKTNRRNILVTITQAGRERVKTEMEVMRRTMTRVFTDMGEADTAEYLRLSKRFFELAHQYMPCPQAKDDIQGG